MAGLWISWYKIDLCHIQFIVSGSLPAHGNKLRLAFTVGSLQHIVHGRYLCIFSPVLFRNKIYFFLPSKCMTYIKYIIYKSI